MKKIGAVKLLVPKMKVSGIATGNVRQIIEEIPTELKILGTQHKGVNVFRVITCTNVKVWGLLESQDNVDVVPTGYENLDETFCLLNYSTQSV